MSAPQQMVARGRGVPYTVTVSTILQQSVNAGNGACSAGVRVQRDGDIEDGISNNSTTPNYAEVGGTPHEWADPDDLGNPGDTHQVRMVYVTGDHLDVGTEDTWEVLSTDREYKMENASGPRTVNFQGTLEIRKGTGAVIDSATVDLDANSFSI